MENKELIMEIKEKLDQLLENAPEEDSSDNSDLIDFYEDAKTLQEDIDNLQIDKTSNLNCYIFNFNYINKKGDHLKRIMVFSKDIPEAKEMIHEAFIKHREDTIEFNTAIKVNPRHYGIEYPNKPQFRILCGDTVLV